MTLRLSRNDIRRTISAAITTAALAGSIGTASPAIAAPATPGAPAKAAVPASRPHAKAAAAPPAAPAQAGVLDPARVVQRARTWTDAKVPYSQTGYRGGYRRDCSGFISMAWDLPDNLVTWNIPLVAKPIAKSDLRTGDVLLNARGGVGGRHVVMFEKWADAKHTKYVLLEQTGSVNRAVRRVMPYPYEFDKNLYKPYRFAGMDRYEKQVPPKDRQVVAGWKQRKAAERAAAAVRAAARKAAADTTSAPTGTSAKPGNQRRPAGALERSAAIAARMVAADPTVLVGGFLRWLGQ